MSIRHSWPRPAVFPALVALRQFARRHTSRTAGALRAWLAGAPRNVNPGGPAPRPRKN